MTICVDSMIYDFLLEQSATISYDIAGEDIASMDMTEMLSMIMILIKNNHDNFFILFIFYLYWV